MEFKSILYQTGYEEKPVIEEPNYFKNLNLDQLIKAITLDKDDYDLKSFFFTLKTNGKHPFSSSGCH
ncbi:hypothetical protein ACIZ62_06525 [Acetobacterium carbinolicum]|uniref:hypothetical protein n=1 Tax=Acetobacterium carbinolicum TaxID=52690 RepID=UPI0039BEF2EF